MSNVVSMHDKAAKKRAKTKKEKKKMEESVEKKKKSPKQPSFEGLEAKVEKGQEIIAKSKEKDTDTDTDIQKTMEKKMSKATAAANNNPFDKIAKETASFGKDYSDACSKSGAIFMKGFEDFIGTVVSLAQASAEKQAKFMKEAMGSKTINEFAELQGKIAQASFDDFMAGATKISEISVKVLTEGTEPVNNQIAKTMHKMTEAMAA